MAASMPTKGEDSGGRILLLAAGGFTLLLGGGAALLPLAPAISGGLLVGWLLLLAGLAELAAAFVRRPDPARGAAFAAGALTTLGGLIFVSNPLVAFVPLSWVVTLWLVARGIIQIAGGLRSDGPVRTWTLFSGAADLSLGLLLLLGLPVAMLVTGLFGPTREMVASFALVFAINFLATGGAMIAVARTHR